MTDRPAANTPLKPRATREEIARVELGHTDLTPAAKWLLVLGLIASILVVPIWQHVHDIRANLREWQSTPPEQRTWTMLLPQFYDIVALAPDWEAIYMARTWWGAFRALPAVREIELYEDAVEDNSVLADAMLSPTQWTLTRLGGTGNEEAVTGRHGWLFYKPGIEYLTGPPFLDPERMENLRRYTPIQPDPVEAIVHWRDQLAERGIELIVVPTPVKPQVHPEQLTSRYAPDHPLLQNASYEEFRGKLDQAGVLLFDPGPTIMAAKLKDLAQAGVVHAQYLRTDTHWTPDAMGRVAAELAAFIREHAGLPEGEPARYRRASPTVRHLGDVAVMLRLPDGQKLYGEQAMTIHPVEMRAGAGSRAGSPGDRPDDDAAWRPATSTGHAPVLLLGDSFTNIYSTPDLGWGEHAGLAEQLTAELALPVDRIAINAGGSFASRQELADRLRTHYAAYEKHGKAPGREPLADKRVVVYQFAMRELLLGDWRLIELPEARTEAFGEVPGPAEDGAPGSAGGVTVRGTLADIARPPRPHSVPYDDAVIAMHLTNVEAVQGAEGGAFDGPPPADGLLVFAFGMRDNEWTPAARWHPGQTVTLRLVPWAAVQDRYGSVQRQDLGTEADFLLSVWWADLAAPKASDAAGGDEDAAPSAPDSATHEPAKE